MGIRTFFKHNAKPNTKLEKVKSPPITRVQIHAVLRVKLHLYGVAGILYKCIFIDNVILHLSNN